MNKKGLLRLSLLAVTLVGLLFFNVQPGETADNLPKPMAATYRTWIAQEPSGNPLSGQTVRVWINSDTAPGETAMLEYNVGSTYTIVYGTYDNTSHPGANWYADIPRHASGIYLQYQLFTRNEFGSYYGHTGFSWSYTVYGPNCDISWTQVLHDSFNADYRSLPGPLAVGPTQTKLRMRVAQNDLSSARVRVWNDLTNTETYYPMAWDSVFDIDQTTYDYWYANIPLPSEPTILYYFFEMNDNGNGICPSGYSADQDYYADDDIKFYGGGYGDMYDIGSGAGSAEEKGYQITLYDPVFDVPEWIQRGVVYQIFPDRFRDGNAANNPTTGRFSYNTTGTIVRSGQSNWNYTVCDPRSTYLPSCADKYGDNFYGGDLAGITEKINAGYFDQMGVSVLYLNPIFRSPSNHKYDTANFMEIDPDFGTLSDFESFAAAANTHNIKIILDGVFNHTSSDSMYFDRYGRYNASGTLIDPDGGTDDNSGACEAGASSFYSWFYFPATGNPGTDGGITVNCPNGLSDANQSYEAWYGYSSLPKLQANSTAVRNLIWNNGTSSVGPYWTFKGASGWRFDVGGDVDPGLTNENPSIPNDYWEGFRSAVRNITVTGKDDTLMLGEEWGDSSPWLLGNEWDSVMNYRYRSAVLSWLFSGCTGNGCSGGTVFSDNDSNAGSSSGTIAYISPSQFNARLRSIQEDYPPMSWMAMMNLADSHDTNRIRFLLKKTNNDSDAAAVQRMKELWLFAFTYAGAPTLYYGDEVGLSHDGVWSTDKWEDDPYNRAPFPWNDTAGSYTADTNLQDFARKMSSIRHSYRALQDGDVQHGIVIDDTNKVYGFARTNATQTALILLNRGSIQQSVTLSGLNAAPYNLPNATILLDVIHGTNTYTVTSGSVTVPVNPTWGVVLLEQAEIETPAAPASPSIMLSGTNITLGWDMVSLDTNAEREVPTSYTIHRSAIAGFTPDTTPVTGNQIAIVNPPAYGIAQSRLTSTTSVVSGENYYSVCAINASGKMSCAPLATQCVADPYLYRSAATGSWTDSATWEVNNGTNWSAASCWPTSSNGTIQIQSGDTVTIQSAMTVDQTTIDSGGQITVNSGVTLTVANGTGTDFTVNGTVVVNGVADSEGAITTTGATLVFNSSGKYQHNFTTANGTIPTATWNNGSTVEFIGYTTNSSYPGGLGQAFSNFNWNCQNQTSNISMAGNLTTVNGNLTVTSTGTGTLHLSASTSPTLTIGGNLIMNGGTFIFSTGTGTPTVYATGDVVLNGGTLQPALSTGIPTFTVAGNWTNNGGTFTPGTGPVTFNGTSAQTIGGTTSTTFNNLTINNSSGVTLGANITVNSTLALGDNTLTTNANTVTLASATGITRGTGFVIGNLQKPVTGTGAVAFELGTGTSYAPINVIFNAVTGSGTLTGSTTAGQHSRYMDTNISDIDYINRWWVLTPSGLTAQNYDATFTFVNPGDFIGSPTTGSLVLQKYSGSTWTDPVTTSSTSTTVTGTGFTSFSDFYAGNGGTPLPVTLSYFTSTRISTEVLFDWSTATETGNVGFNLYAQDGDQRIRLNQELIPSQATDSLSHLDYSFQAETSSDIFYIEDINVNGLSDLHGPYQLGEEHGSRMQENKIDWDSIQSDHAESQSLNQAGLRLELAGRPEMLSLNLKVRQTGLFRVTYEMLRDAGLDLFGLPAAKLMLTNGGINIPIYVAGADPFGPGGFIEFHGQALDTIYTDTNIYTLKVSPTPLDSLLKSEFAFNRVMVGKVSSYTETLEIHNQLGYANYSPGTDAWYDTSMLAFKTAKSWEFPFKVDGLANSREAANLELVVWGVTDWPQSPDHRLLVSINGVQIAADTFDGLMERTIKVKLAAGLLHEGDNTLKLTLPADTGVEWDMINLDKFSVSYPRKLQAREGRLAFKAAGSSFTVTNLPSADVVVYRLNGKELTSRLELVKVLDNEDGTFSATFGGSRNSAGYLVSTVDAMYAPEFEMARTQVDLNRPAEYLIIAHPNFINGLQPLIQAREAQGLKVSVVDVTDLYARYTNGIFDPQAIKQYIAYAVKNLDTQYVLLVGGDTYDYRNYLGVNSISFIPSLYVSTGPIAHFVPVDPQYADVNDDNVPDVAIGRFPVRTVTELNLMVSKTLAYGNKSYGQTAVFASDLNDGGLSFKNINNAMTAQLPDGWTADNIHLNDVNVITARTELIAAMNRGTALVTYTGHSGPQEWTFSNLFNINNAATLTNHGKPFVVTQWGCWNNYYVDPIYNYLVQSFLFSGDQGAAAVLGASTLTDSTSEVLLGELLMPHLAARGMPIGQALQSAKSELAQTHPELLDVLLGWSLMGDPALVIDP